MVTTSDAAGSDQPTVLLRMADAGDLYLSWRWAEDLAAPGVARVPEHLVLHALAGVAAALPGSADADTDPAGLTRALRTGHFADYDAELALAEQLSRIFLPYGLAVALHEMQLRGVRPHLRIQPSPRVAQIPWELLAPDRDLRFLDLADISVLAPTTIVHSSSRRPRSWAQTRELPVVAVLDPRIPGFRADSTLGSVLGRITATDPVAGVVAEHARRHRLRPELAGPDAAVTAFRRTDLDRDWLAAALAAGASRLLYVGHVTAAAPETGRSEDARLHLSCTAETVGHAPPIRGHRPLSAKDLLVGTHGLDEQPHSGAHRWPIPSRVALIACESGGDLRFGEALGLASAMVHGGAELVTATRWLLPTDLAFQRIACVDQTVRPLQDAIVAIDAAHETEQPVRALSSWQRECLTAWRTERSIEYSPLLWAAFATIDATGTRPVDATSA